MQTSMLAANNERYIEYGVDGVTLFRYVYESKLAANEVPKPFFHPLRTLNGEEVTIYRPHDHGWHSGLMMTISHLEDKNFWGGPSFIEGIGYQMRQNHGVIEHTRFDHIELDGKFALDESLLWKPDTATVWLEETRHINVAEINQEAGYWMLTFKTSLKNVSDRPLKFGSPSTNGRPNAGYGSFFWRGPRSFTGGKLIAPEDREDYMGASFPWLAYQAKSDTSHQPVTLLFIDDPSNLRYPNKWFVRTEPYACVSYSFMFDEVYELAAGDTLALTYHLALIDGAPERAKLAQIAAR